MISPEFWTDEKLGLMPIEARLLFMGLVSNADDEGRLPGNTLLVKSMVFPYDNYSTNKLDEWLKLLHQKHLIIRYVVDFQTYIQVVNFLKHQTINKPTKSKLPEFVSDTGELREDYGSNTVGLPDDYFLKEKKEKEVKLSVLEVFNYWNEKKIIVHKELTPDMNKAIEKALTKYSEGTIKASISNYEKVLTDKEYYFNYKWTLIKFLTQDNCLVDFMDDGEKWINYQSKEKDNPKDKYPANF